MQNTINTFPASSNEYFNNKLDDLSNYQWLFDPTNPYHFCFWVSVLISKIHILSLMKRWTFFKLKNLPKRLPESITKSIATLSLTLNRLVAIGVLDMRVIKKNKQYKVNWAFLHSTNTSTVNNPNLNPSLTITRTIFDENFVESPFDSINYEDDFFSSIEDGNNNRSLDHQVTDDLSTDNLLLVNPHNKNLTVSDPITEIATTVEEKEITVNVATPNPEPLITLDPIEIDIKERFEAITGKTLNLKKNRKPLAELKQIAKDAMEVVILAFQNVKDYVSKTNSNIYNLSYIVATAKNLLNPKANTPKAVTNSELEIQAHLSIGGDLAKHRGVAPTPEQQATQLDLDKIYIETKERNNKLRDYFFKALPENEQINLIDQKKEQLKNDILLWAKLKGFYPKALVQYCINRIKDDLLESYLIHQEFLTGEQP